MVTSQQRHALLHYVPLQFPETPSITLASLRSPILSVPRRNCQNLITWVQREADSESRSSGGSFSRLLVNIRRTSTPQKGHEITLYPYSFIARFGNWTYTIIYLEPAPKQSQPDQRTTDYLLIYEESCSRICERMYGQFTNRIDTPELSSVPSTDSELNAS